MNMLYLWLAVIVIFLILEAVTAGLTSVWFALGALGAAVSTAFSAPLWLQAVIFIVVSVIALLIARPVAKKHVNSKVIATNADRVLSMTGIVTETIDNITSTGAVSIGGKVWTARSFDGSRIDIDILVNPVSIDGVKLIVQPVQEDTGKDKENGA